VERSVRAARQAHEESGISVEVIDLRSLSPFDWEAVETSVKKTGKALVSRGLAHLRLRSGNGRPHRRPSFRLPGRAGPARGGHRHFCAYQPLLEDVILPQIPKIHDAILELAKY